MNIRIYQINRKRDTDRMMFMNAEYLKEKTGAVKPDSAAYDFVFEGKVDCGTLEEVFQMFNLNRPENYAGRSLSVSDVVEVTEGGMEKPGFYFCDAIGFKEVPFDPEMAQTPTEKRTINVVLAEPGKIARPARIDGTLEGMQKVVGGYIEAMYPFEEEVCLVCNEEGKINGLPLNRALRDEDGEIHDVVAGTFFICGCGGENFSGLNDEQLKRYAEMFKFPERFVRFRDGIIAIKDTVREREDDRER